MTALTPLSEEARAVIAPVVDVAPSLDAAKIADLRVTLQIDASLHEEAPREGTRGADVLPGRTNTTSVAGAGR